MFENRRLMAAEAKMIPKEASERIARENKTLARELQETKSALVRFQSMEQVMADQVKTLKLMFERQKDEKESLHKTLRELSSEDHGKQSLSKMHYVVMLSRWQEATVNKKYEVKIRECNQYSSECMRLQQELEVKHNEFIKSEEEARMVRV